MKHRKIRTYPPVIVTLLVTLAFTMAAAASIIAEQRAAIQRQAGEPIIAQVTPEVNLMVDRSMIYSLDFDGKDTEILLKIAMAEAEGENVEGKALVMLAVLNRVWSNEFPNSIEEVVFQENQFSPTVPGGRYWTTTPDTGCYEALELVMGGWDESQGALYFESTGCDGWHSRNLEFLFQYGGHKFYR